ncbi:hypothetical protein MFMK1_000492 [Metallumcola ferriviriculae]|uniref:Uncharacterized protein n=1 Tax=Metallumcola ferriviriculae TaxID=3039180 RepID=A0AAU0UJB7_9FIRM|nr:hypothetical protein MFMK1_000492 [Desulfitibacteraceae bacterium MK1]
MNRKLLALFLMVGILIFAASLPAMAYPGMSDSEGNTAQGESPGGIIFEAHHFFITPNETGIEVSETYVINNPGEAVTGDKTIELAVPEGVTEIIPYRGLEEGAYQLDEGNLVLSQEITQGQNVIAFGYTIKSDDTTFPFKETVNFSTSFVSVILPPHGMAVTNEDFTDDGVQQFDENTQYKVFSKSQLEQGTELNFQVAFSGSGPAASGGTDPHNEGGTGAVTQAAPEFHSAGHIRFWQQSPFAGMNAHLFLFLVIVVPIAATGYYFYRRSQDAAEMARANSEDEEEEQFQKLLKKQDSLMSKLKELEMQRKNKEIDDETYNKLKDTYKKRLIKVRAKLKEFVG